MNMATKRGVFGAKGQEYWGADKRRKGELLDAVVEVSGLTRKGAIRRFRRMRLEDLGVPEQRGRPRYYTPDVIAALKEVWDMGSEACGENLHPMIGEYIDTQVRDSCWHHSAEATAKLRAMSLGSVKAYVGKFPRTRRNFGGRGTTEKSSIISMVPIRTDGWDAAAAGVTQIDTVAHCGDSIAGSFVYTVNATDVATLWGTRRAQWQKGQEATRASIETMRADSPFPWTELHPDSGGEFINWHLLGYVEETGLRMTRSRPYHKNDNRYVEERNGHVVRAYVGWQRLDARETVDALNALYDVLTSYLNHFIANRRTIAKERVGARWKVTREQTAKTPYERALARDDVSEQVKDRLRTEHRTLNPKTMRVDVDRLTKRVFAVQERHGTPKKPLKSA